MRYYDSLAFLLVVWSTVLTACGARMGTALPGPADAMGVGIASLPPDVVELVQLGAQAIERARTVAADASLHQVSFNFSSRQYFFEFTGGQPRQEITATVTRGTLPPAWRITSTRVSPLVDTPLAELRLASLTVGPEAVVEAMRQAAERRYGAVEVLVATAVVEEGRPVWYVVADVPQGRISGKLTSLTAGLQLLGPGPVRPPVTASPR
ncbi:MAG TPA: hypothetical protein VFB73_05825 [Chloroflexota bacterium]|nr:hypothetical protein [Chloroflexota bacterium]